MKATIHIVAETYTMPTKATIHIVAETRIIVAEMHIAVVNDGEDLDLRLQVW